MLWRGQDLIPNAVEALHAFRAAGKRLLFVTNNSSKSRQEYVEKFKALGIDVSAQEVRGSAERGAGTRWQQLGPQPHAFLLYLCRPPCKKHCAVNTVPRLSSLPACVCL